MRYAHSRSGLVHLQCRFSRRLWSSRQSQRHLLLSSVRLSLLPSRPSLLALRWNILGVSLRFKKILWRLSWTSLQVLHHALRPSYLKNLILFCGHCIVRRPRTFPWQSPLAAHRPPRNLPFATLYMRSARTACHCPKPGSLSARRWRCSACKVAERIHTSSAHHASGTTGRHCSSYWSIVEVET